MLLYFWISAIIYTMERNVCYQQLMWQNSSICKYWSNVQQPYYLFTNFHYTRTPKNNIQHHSQPVDTDNITRMDQREENNEQTNKTYNKYILFYAKFPIFTEHIMLLYFWLSAIIYTIQSNVCYQQLMWQNSTICKYLSKSKKYRQHNDQQIKDKQRSTITHKTKDRVTLKTEGKLRCSERVSSYCFSRGTVVLLYLQTRW
jgi:hypothetical protein